MPDAASFALTKLWEQTRAFLRIFEPSLGMSRALIRRLGIRTDATDSEIAYLSAYKLGESRMKSSDWAQEIIQSETRRWNER